MVLSYILCFCLVVGGSMTPVRARALSSSRNTSNTLGPQAHDWPHWCPEPDSIKCVSLLSFKYLRYILTPDTNRERLIADYNEVTRTGRGLGPGPHWGHTASDMSGKTSKISNKTPTYQTRPQHIKPIPTFLHIVFIYFPMFSFVVHQKHIESS